MEHFADLNYSCNITPVAVNCWANENQRKPREIRSGIRYKKTRSTLAMNAIDLSGLKDDQATDMFKCLMRLCKTLKREEIVIECLETLPESTKDRSVSECFNMVQSDITRASRKMNLCPPRVALEKRGQHFDLRIYPTFH